MRTCQERSRCPRSAGWNLRRERHETIGGRERRGERFERAACSAEVGERQRVADRRKERAQRLRALEQIDKVPGGTNTRWKCRRPHRRRALWLEPDKQFNWTRSAAGQRERPRIFVCAAPLERPIGERHLRECRRQRVREQTAKPQERLWKKRRAIGRDSRRQTLEPVAKRRVE